MTKPWRPRNNSIQLYPCVCMSSNWRNTTTLPLECYLGGKVKLCKLYCCTTLKIKQLSSEHPSSQPWRNPKTSLVLLSDTSRAPQLFKEFSPAGLQLQSGWADSSGRAEGRGLNPAPSREGQLPPGAEGPQQARPETAPHAHFLPLPVGVPAAPFPAPQLTASSRGSSHGQGRRAAPKLAASPAPCPRRRPRSGGRGGADAGPALAQSAAPVRRRGPSPAKTAARDRAAPFRAPRASPWC